MVKKTTKTKEKDTAPKERKLDMFREVIPAIDRRNMNFWTDLSDEQKKELSPWLVQRWASSAEAQAEWQEYFIQATNERVNMHMADLSKHPELLWMLLASTGAKKGFRRSWLGASKRAKKDHIMEFLGELYPNAGEQELELLREINDEAELKQIAEQMNLKTSEIKEVFGG
jgi:broad specificity phosphatase PhoE